MGSKSHDQQVTVYGLSDQGLKSTTKSYLQAILNKGDVAITL